MQWPERLLVPIPNSIGDAEALSSSHWARSTRARPFARRLPEPESAYRCGPIGLLLVELLRLRGASAVIATDRLEHRVAGSSAMGATAAFVVDADAGPDGSAARKLFGTRSRVAFEVSGSDEALDDANRCLRPGGRIVILGSTAGSDAFGAGGARRKELTLQLCRGWLLRTCPMRLSLRRPASSHLSELITHRYPCPLAREAFATLAERSGI